MPRLVQNESAVGLRIEPPPEVGRPEFPAVAGQPIERLRAERRYRASAIGEGAQLAGRGRYHPLMQLGRNKQHVKIVQRRAVQLRQINQPVHISLVLGLPKGPVLMRIAP